MPTKSTQASKIKPSVQGWWFDVLYQNSICCGHISRARELYPRALTPYVSNGPHPWMHWKYAGISTLPRVCTRTAIFWESFIRCFRAVFSLALKWNQYSKQRAGLWLADWAGCREIIAQACCLQSPFIGKYSEMKSYQKQEEKRWQRFLYKVKYEWCTGKWEELCVVVVCFGWMAGFLWQSPTYLCFLICDTRAWLPSLQDIPNSIVRWD